MAKLPAEVKAPGWDTEEEEEEEEEDGGFGGTVAPMPIPTPATDGPRRRGSVAHHFPTEWGEHQETKIHSRFNATQAVFPTSSGTVKWKARAQRKGRHPSIIATEGFKPEVEMPNLRFWGWDFHDVSWWVAQTFLWGSVAWTISGYLAFFQPGDNPALDSLIGVWIGFVGGMLFQVGAYFGFLEALNREEKVHQGYAAAADGSESLDADAARRGKLKTVVHARQSFVKRASVTRSISSARRRLESTQALPLQGGKQDGGGGGSMGMQPAFSAAGPNVGPNGGGGGGGGGGGDDEHVEQWVWWGYRWDEVGYVAAFIQLVGATVFSIAVVAEMPGVIKGTYEESYVAWDVLVWTPFFVGSVCFVLANTTMMLEEQDKWWKPQWGSLGWHLSVWNVIGSIGFLSSSAFGYLAYPCDCYQKWGTDFSTFWGSAAFIVASYLLLIESLNKHPAEFGDVIKHICKGSLVCH